MNSDKELSNIIDNKDTNRSSYYPEVKLAGRGKLAFDWIPQNCNRLLDGGCAYGYITKHLSKKSEKTYALDLDHKHIEIATNRYPEIEFQVGSVSETKFEDNFFDTIVSTDVLEHTEDKIQTLNELSRILAPGGTLILTTPHKGLFGFLDPYNYGYNFKKYFPWIYKPTYKFIRLLKEGKLPKEYNPLHDDKHFHYSIKDFHSMLDQSKFSGNYSIEKVFRSGLFLEVFTMNLETIIGIILSKKILNIILKPLTWASMVDYRIDYGVFGYNIAIKIIKKP